MHTSRSNTATPSWIWIAIIWFAIGFLDATQTVLTMRSQGMHHAWTELFITLQMSWLPWVLATPWVMFLSRRYPISQANRLATWCVHLGAIFGITLVWALWVSLFEVALNPWLKSPVSEPFSQVWPVNFFHHLLSAVILYAFIVSIAFLLDSRARIAQQRTEAAQLNEQLSKAQLNALRRQLEPHFLFNTLNAIAGLVREQKNEAAVNSIVRLSDFLRKVVKDSNRTQVPLLEEVEFLEQYLEIQKMRLGNRLQTTVDVPAHLLKAIVPNLVLQPLVENAIKHGIAKRAQGGAIHIGASNADGMLNLNVYNDGPGLPADWETADAGTGIANLKNRLQILYGSRFELHLQDRENTGVLVSVSVPYREAS